jgi:hypothetical protein
MHKWNVKGYPTLIYTDGSQAILDRSGAPGSVAGFERTVARFLAEHGG